MGTPTKILLLEDEPELVEMFSAQLKKAGYDVRVGNTGKQGLELLRAQLPDIMLLDLVMPEMDGYEVLKQMNADPKLKGVRVFAWSNLTQEGEIAQAKKLGVEDYLIKSDYTPSKLVAKIEELLQKK
jgi:CheY-like chemotaxis protein